ncbi:hypothetical protein ALC62_04566 [Cyphomyrmex costatus]|uniref:Uncharacterized protein n=1 Tax=Cyphomyrmex costatus TaxID=456900 RepID=A0A195CVB6_9HYME|nr:hypothetical protein ALC62_04566 [Cyphomyrmex costatus]
MWRTVPQIDYIDKVPYRVADTRGTVNGKDTWSVKEPVPRLENRDTAALKCICSQKKKKNAVARADRGEYLRRGGMHIQDGNDAISMAHT